MSTNKGIRVPYNLPFSEIDPENQAYECRADNPDICANNGLLDKCAFSSKDSICKRPSKAWKKQYKKLLGGQIDE